MVGHLSLVGPAILRTEDSLQSADDAAIHLFSWIGLFDGNECFHETLTDILCHLTHITPMGTIGDADDKVLALCSSKIFTALAYELAILLVIHIRDALEEQQREDVLFVTSCINLATQTCSRSPEELLHLVE